MSATIPDISSAQLTALNTRYHMNARPLSPEPACTLRIRNSSCPKIYCSSDLQRFPNLKKLENGQQNCTMCVAKNH